MKSYLAKSRLVPLVLIFGMILLIFCGVLYNTQILNGSDYKARSLASNATAQTVEALSLIHICPAACPMGSMPRRREAIL